MYQEHVKEHCIVYLLIYAKLPDDECSENLEIKIVC